MNLSKKNFIFILLLAFLVVTPVALGATNLLDQILRPFSGINVGQTYLKYSYFVDAVIFFIIFIGVAQSVLGEKFKSAPIVPTMIGIILGIAMAVFELRTGFNLGKLWWFVGLAVFLLLGFLVYRFITSMGGNALIAFSVAYIIIYLLVQNTAPALMAQILQLDWLGAILSMLFILAIFGVIMGVVKLVKDVGSGEWNRKQGEKIEKERENMWKRFKNNRAAKKMAEIDGEFSKVENQLNEMIKLEEDINNRELQNSQQQLELVQQLQKLIDQTWKFQQSLQNVYSNINKPEYEQYRDKAQEYSTMLDRYINSIRTISARLLEKIQENDRN